MNQYSQCGPFQRFRASLRVRVAIRIAAICLLFASSVLAADQKLIMKDGTDQIVKSYEVTGDRVRYFSAERLEWEEMPASLVDWDATEEAKRAAEKVPEIEAEKDRPDPRRVLAPSAILSDEEGVYAFNGKFLLPLAQSQTAIVNDLKRKILGVIAPLPVIKGHAWILLPGASAAQSVMGENLAIYLQLANPAKDGYALVRVQPKDDKRIVGEIAMSSITRSLSESRQIVPSTSEEVLPAADGKLAVMRLSPITPLQPGEYAIVEFIAKDKQNLLVWDFHYSQPTQAATKP